MKTDIQIMAQIDLNDLRAQMKTFPVVKLAEMCGVDAGSISRIANGQRNPSFLTARKIQHAMNIIVADGITAQAA